MFFEMRFDLGTLDSGERSLPLGLLVPSNFVSIWSCSAYLDGIILGKNTFLYLENEAK